MASTCRKDPRTAETMRKGCGNGVERPREWCGKTAGTVRGLSFKAVTLRRCCGNSAERLRKHCGHNVEHGRSRCGRDVGVHSWATINRWNGIWNGTMEWTEMEWNGEHTQLQLTRVTGAAQSRLNGLVYL